MTDRLSLTRKWLRQSVQPYSQSDLVFHHVDDVLSTYPTLRPKTDVYTYDDGRSELLLCIHGLLPIEYRRASYNIPIALWITHQYPTQPPLVYVVPTSDMMVKPGKFINVSGWCEPAYIKAWSKKSEGCNLKGLVEVLDEQFSQEPPVYAKPQVAPPTPPRDTPNHGMASPSPQTFPQSNGSTAISPRARPPTHPRPPPVPEHPNRSPISPVPYASHVPSQTVFHPPRSTTSIDGGRDPPLYSTPAVHARPHVRTPSSQYSPPPSQAPSHFRLDPRHIPQRWSLPPGSISIQPSGPSPPGVPEPTLPIQVPPSGPSVPPGPPIHSISGIPPPPTSQIHPRNYLDEDLGDDGLSSALPASNVPPRPPNPEILRLHAELHAKFASEFVALDRTLAADMERLQTAQADLLAGEPAIRDEMARLQAVRDVCRVVAERYRSTIENARANLHELRRKGDPEVDELICSTTIVYNQLINLIAEDNAIEDTIYHLHRALNAGRIDLDKFLRTTRSLAEEQFMKRALAAKIVSSIPLGAWS